MNKSETITTDRLPPHSPECEQAVLGCCFIDPNDAIPKCVRDFKRAGVEVFYDLRHQTIYSVIVEMWDDQDPIDTVTVMNRLNTYGMLEKIGGALYLSSLRDCAPSAANIEYYSSIIFEKFLMRKMIRVCVDSVARIYDFEGEIDDLLDGVERDILEVNQLRVQQRTRGIREIVNESITQIEEANRSKGKVAGLETGFIDLDKLSNGLMPGEMIIIAARPSMGKTSLAMNIAENVCVNNKVPVGVFSLEMTDTQLVTRMICSRSRVNLRNVRDGFLSERDFPKLVNSASAIANAPIYLDDSSGISIMELRARARRMYQQYAVRLFIIDYLQLLHAMDGRRKFDSRQQEISFISGGIKSLAKELRVPVMVLSQLNRQVERDKKRKPALADLRESGAIEQDADFVGLLYKPLRPGEEEEDFDESSIDAIPVNLLIGKQRNGPSGVDVNLTFLKMYTRFESAAKIFDNDVPSEQREIAYDPSQS